MRRFIVDSLCVTLGDRRILSGAYLEAAAGDRIAILGRNGSGKSTLFRCLLGLHRHATGSVRLDGVPLSPPHRLSRLAYLPQDSFLPRDRSVRKGVGLLSTDLLRGPIISQDARAQHLLDQKAGTLSGGELRYMECLLVLSMNKEVLLLDEPFSQVEPLYCEVLRSHIRRVSPNRVIIMTDHLYHDVRKVCNRFLVLRGGQVWAVDPDSDNLAKQGYLPGK